MRKMYAMKTVARICLATTLLAGLSVTFGCTQSTKADSTVDPVVRPAVKAKTVVKTQTIPSGTVLRISLQDSLDTNQSSANDRFMASLSEPVLLNGTTVLPKGTLVYGRVIDVQGAGKVKGRASIRLELTQLVHGNKTFTIATNPFSAEAASTQGRDAGVIAGGAGLGAVIGAIAGGKKGAGIGAIGGGGAGTGVVLATKGKEIHYGPETGLNFTLAHSVTL
jgi:hypothetical protein